MKLLPRVSPLPQSFRRLQLAALASAVVTLCGSALAFDPDVTCPALANAVSRFPVIIDGRFTDGVDEGGRLRGEWSDIVPQAFVVDPSGALFRTCLDDPAAGSIVYTSLAPEQIITPSLTEGGGAPVEALYLMYDFLAAQKNPSLFSQGQTLAQVSFGVHLPASLGGIEGQNTPITVRFVVANPIIGVGRTAAAVVGEPGTFIDVVFDVNIPEGQTNVPGFRIGLEGAVTFGPSVNSTTPHLQAELEVGLRIPAGFGTPGGPFPGNGIDPATGLYDPAPKFWGSGFNDAPGGGGEGGPLARASVLIPSNRAASANLVTINPDGSVRVNSGADAGPGFVPFDTTNLRTMVLDKVKALRAASTDTRTNHELDEVIGLLTASLKPIFYLDAARLAPRKGLTVFALDAGAVDELTDLIRSKKTAPSLAAVLPGCVDQILGLDGEFARVAIVDAIAAGADGKRITQANNELARGDADAAAGRNVRAIVRYASAWKIATKTNSRDDDRD